MVCRCPSKEVHAARAVEQAQYSAQQRDTRARHEIEKLQRQLAALTPDPTVWAIERVQGVGDHLVLQVRFPACEHAGYGGAKVLVYLGVSTAQALLWKHLDPHFSEREPGSPSEAPPPSARFPASDVGWGHAVGFAAARVR